MFFYEGQTAILLYKMGWFINTYIYNKLIY
jgi:hypothetical protein